MDTQLKTGISETRTINENCAETFDQWQSNFWTVNNSWTKLVDKIRNWRHLQISHWRTTHCARIPVQLEFHTKAPTTRTNSRHATYSFSSPDSSCSSSTTGTNSSTTSSSGSSSFSSQHSSPTPSTSGTRPKQSLPATSKTILPDSSQISGTTSPAATSTTQNLRQQTKVDYKDLHTGSPRFGREQFQNKCSGAGASVRKSVAKLRKMSLAELFPPISRNSSSSSMASSKWGKANSFRIPIWNKSTRRASTSQNPNYSSKTLDAMSGFRSTSPRFWTPRAQSNKTTSYCWKNMKSLLKQLPKLLPMSVSSRSLHPLRTSKTSSKVFHSPSRS